MEVNYTTLLPTETYDYIPTSVSRANSQDYKLSSGSVLFAAGQTVNTFDIEILDDTEPEEDEAVYVRLTGLRLITAAQIRPGNLTFNQSHQTVNTFDIEILDDM